MTSTPDQQNLLREPIIQAAATDDEDQPPIDRAIDFVMVWKPHPDTDTEADRQAKRNMFEERLSADGLYLTESEVDGSFFICIYAPDEVLLRYAEVLRLRLPIAMQPSEAQQNQQHQKLKSWPTMIGGSRRRRCAGLLPTWLFRTDRRQFPKLEHRFTAVYSRDKHYLFDQTDRRFMPPSVRSRIVAYMLERKRYMPAEVDANAFGMERMLAQELYVAAFPLHDGDVRDETSMRHRLVKHWATLGKWHRAQPLDYVKNYLGVKIGLYFAWLGFYTYMLVVAAIVGVLCFAYSLSVFRADLTAAETCDGDQLMCPACDRLCDFELLRDSCSYAWWSALFDNGAAVFFAAFMSLWSAVYLTMWRRYEAEITHHWDLTGFDRLDEPPRPQFLASMSSGGMEMRQHAVTKLMEPHPSYWGRRVPARLLSASVVMMLVVLMLVGVMGVVLYRVAVVVALQTTSASLFATVTSATLNLIMIVVFDMFYERLAVFLTNFEMPRTQSEYNDSLGLKRYLLAFVNYYSSIFYIAFIKGNFTGRPGRYRRYFGLRPGNCATYGCLMEVTIQLAIIMVGKQLFTSVVVLLSARGQLWWRRYRRAAEAKMPQAMMDETERRLCDDLELLPWTEANLYGEYQQMILQYGFVTIFVAAFPLAPLFALIRNITEIRQDAHRILCYHRRPIVRRVSDIGVWHQIMETVSMISVLSNGLIIAFTSDFVPRLVYRHYYAQDGTLRGYVNGSLSVFDVADLEEGTSPLNTRWPDAAQCRYQDRRNGPDGGEHAYEYSAEFYTVLAWRLIFVVLFENALLLMILLVRWCVPEQSARLRAQIKREAYLTNELIIRRERQNMLAKHEHFFQGKKSVKRRSKSLVVTTVHRASV